MKISYLVFILVWFALGLGACIFLAMNEHPWLAGFVLFITASISIKDDGKTVETSTESDK